MSDMSEESPPERVPLDWQSAEIRRRRAVSSLIVVALIAAAIGGIVGLIGNRTAGLVAALIVAAPMVYIVVWANRRRTWLDGHEIVVRTWGERRIDLVTAKRIDLLITEVRFTRTIGLLVSPHDGGSVKINLAEYAGTEKRELDVLKLRKLADAVADNIDANGMVFSELLVAQLRAEARGDHAEARPLYRLAAAAPKGKLAQRYTMEAVSRFVASLD